jgi:hypothetical protein
MRYLEHKKYKNRHYFEMKHEMNDDIIPVRHEENSSNNGFDYIN